MPPPGYEPLMRAVCADPEDDTVRLVYADWLDENGDPDRAEFIRLQVAQAQQPAADDATFRRATELQVANHKRWRAELPYLRGIVWGDWFRRGFLQNMTVQAGKWLRAHHAAAFGATPVQAVSLDSAGQGTLERVLPLAEWDRVTILHLTNCRISPDQFRVISSCPTLTRLRCLGVYRSVPNGQGGRVVVTDDEARELAASPHLPALEELRFGGSISASAAAVLRTRYKTVHAWHVLN